MKRIVPKKLADVAASAVVGLASVASLGLATAAKADAEVFQGS